MTHKLKVIIHRSHIQGGLTNEEVDGIKGVLPFTNRMFFNLDEFWKIHVTNYVKQWKKYGNIYQCPFEESITPEDNYSDIYDLENNNKARYAKLINNNYVLFPNTNPEEINLCIRDNYYYYLYDFESIHENTIEIMIYWIPIFFIDSWYDQYGENNMISRNQMKNCIENQRLFRTFNTIYV
jgi:hypothetical protein